MIIIDGCGTVHSLEHLWDAILRPVQAQCDMQNLQQFPALLSEEGERIPNAVVLQYVC